MARDPSDFADFYDPELCGSRHDKPERDPDYDYDQWRDAVMDARAREHVAEVA